ncbi:hypothetical protein T265_06232 [Opisthorchis viverrini]|uniref:Uncharacterized protein n=1 Tax=Opisthorchis viverrini TaxID=6198 RepID=A0A075AE55_OPIVI|nr:hypothetical protein T265_06232 [Opisthorchis viverrini]KER26509.1 hypothetical protein T265_06232 [Opisthorchis viverrini]
MTAGALSDTVEILLKPKSPVLLKRHLLCEAALGMKQQCLISYALGLSQPPAAEHARLLSHRLRAGSPKKTLLSAASSAGILQGSPSLDKRSLEAEAGFEPRTLRPDKANIPKNLEELHSRFVLVVYDEPNESRGATDPQDSQWLRSEITDRKTRGWRPIPLPQLLLFTLEQRGSISGLMPPSGGMKNMHRKDVASERFFPNRPPDTTKERILLRLVQVLTKLISERHKSDCLRRSSQRKKKEKKVFSCSTLPVPSCHATRRKHEGWDTARLPKPRQGKSSGGGRIRTTDLPVSKFAL